MCGRFLLGSRNASWPALDTLRPRGNYLDRDGNVERTESATMASEEIMDLRKTVPRSPKDKMLGLVSLKRTIDKAKAHNEGHLGEYDYDCPRDRPLFEFLGTNGDEFASPSHRNVTTSRPGLTCSISTSTVRCRSRLRPDARRSRCSCRRSAHRRKRRAVRPHRFARAPGR